MNGSINGISLLASDKPLTLVADMQYMEPYSSTALNRKLKNIVKPGFYAGFKPVPGEGLNLVITSSEVDNKGAASIDVNDVQISVQQINNVTIPVKAGAISIIVLEANYKFGVRTTQVDITSSIPATQVLALVGKEPASNQIEICRVAVPEGAKALTLNMIDTSHRLSHAIGVQFSNSTTSTEEHVAASSLAVKKLRDELLALIAGQSLDSWEYNNGAARGGETEVTVGEGIKRVAAVYVNGYYQHGKFKFDPKTRKLTLSGQLRKNDSLLCLTNDIAVSAGSGATQAAQISTDQGVSVQQFVTSMYEHGVIFANTRAEAMLLAPTLNPGTLVIVTADESFNNSTTLVRIKDKDANIQLITPLSNGVSIDFSDPLASQQIGHMRPDGTTTKLGAYLNEIAKELAKLKTHPALDFGLIK
ncbi:tail fiber protein (plasmid) [Raoultella ornithinolytica]|uniref:tail fiber protein n=1 Tax=Raoultella ornithinolytica TaxID=54291 RepID=UPI00292C4FE3|nr:tail fiber protein [Raoultella ornithinolytica]MDV1094946.1 tail fiber protein [Raoultella ornithinolytica]MDV1122710.1 tail fiber protein [Raoultella ornithinolytica]MDV1893225.1 tail fiber protein [Raoultella ornithinolytica]